ncbi:MAG: class D sortase [Poseidonibacter sp.]|uniref:class D sortase n=1 Tax=Poseidonibacter sp. TaxID=2321188 RepID=UPI00359E883D
MKKYFPYILIGAGIVIIIVALFQNITTDYYQHRIMEEYSEYISELKTLETADKQEHSEIENEEKIEISSEKEQEDEKEPKTVEDEINERKKLFGGQEISGIIEIPKINVGAAILEGTDDKALKYAVGHYPETANPGEQGNCVLLGHRNYVYGHFFRRIDELEIGDEIIIRKDTYTYTYEVTESFVVSPEETWVLNDTGNAEITMITCTPIGIYTDRLVVKAVLLDEGSNN